MTAMRFEFAVLSIFEKKRRLDYRDAFCIG